MANLRFNSDDIVISKVFLENINYEFSCKCYKVIYKTKKEGDTRLSVINK